jgi:hypothetical protein
MPIVVSPITPVGTTSGTTAFNLDLGDLVEEAFERCGSEMRTAYDLRTARRSLNLLFADWANRGINLWTLDSGTVPLVSGTATYALPADTVDLLDCVIRINSGVVATQSDQVLSRISNSTYSNIPNKLNTGKPIQMVVTRAGAAPTTTLYPVPDGAATYTLVYWRMRRIQDAGEGVDVTSDVPFRMLPALASGLAYYLAFKLPDAGQRIPVLKEVYDEDWQRASDEDREKATFRITPFVGRM